MYNNIIDTQLITACRKNDINKVKELLEEGHNPNEKNNVGGAPLHIAFYNKYTGTGDDYLKVMKLLLKNKANPDITNCNIEKPVRAICDDKTVNTKAFLMQTVHEKALLTRTVLEKAYFDNDTKAVKLLLDYGADRKLTSSTGEVLLEIACKNDDIEKVKLLLSSRDNDVCSILSRYNDKYLLKTKKGEIIERTTSEVAKESGSNRIYEFINNKVKDAMINVLVISKAIRDKNKQGKNKE